MFSACPCSVLWRFELHCGGGVKQTPPWPSTSCTQPAPEGGSVRRDVSETGWTRQEPRWWGLYFWCGGGGFCKVPLAGLSTRCSHSGELAEQLYAAWAPGTTSAWRCVAAHPGDSPWGRERGTPTPTDPSSCHRYLSVLMSGVLCLYHWILGRFLTESENFGISLSMWWS